MIHKAFPQGSEAHSQFDQLWRKMSSFQSLLFNIEFHYKLLKDLNPNIDRDESDN